MVRSVLWLITIVIFFLSVVSLGPYIVQRYQYALTKGELEAKYDLAVKALPAVAESGAPVVSELVVHKIRPSVVSIEATTFRRGRRIGSKGQGSGVVISSEGLVVTNNHVVQDADEIIVTLADRRQIYAEIVGTDERTDLAVIRIKADGLTPAAWGDSTNLELGSQVWAMGSPFGLEQTVTKGILSGKHRAVSDSKTKMENQFQDLLQTDAAINPGNSGGPLVNSRGEIIGINVSIYGKVFQGISFAVPSSLAKQIVEKLIKYGKVDRGFLGVNIQDVTHSDQINLGLDKISGAKVIYVTPGSAAFRAGIRKHDVITEIAGQKIDSTLNLFRYIGLQDPGTKVDIQLVRNGIPFRVTAKVSSRDEIENQ